MTIETAGFNLSDSELCEYTNLFKYILQQAKHPNASHRLRGNIILSLDGNGRVKMKVESYHELTTIPVNGTGADKTTKANSP